MNGPQDMGGLQGYGPVMPEENEPVFHGEWEEKVLALTLAAGFLGQWNIDMGRHTRESLPPAQYISSSYYQIWLAGLENLLQEKELISGEELAAGKASSPRAEVKSAPGPDAVPGILMSGGPSEREPAAPTLFGVGDKVRTRNIHPTGHTRLPRYVRGSVGEIIYVNGAHVFPDSNAHGLGEDPHWLYTVRFSARQLWGEEANPDDFVNVDCWEPYLEKPR
ncbi:MAG: nitrile hydratase subunit beta [Hyphomicrobiales bacterium]